MSILRALDVSSHQSRDLTTLIRAHQPKHVIVKLYTAWESVPWDHTAAQVRSALDNGCTVGGYVWAYRSVTPERMVDDLIARCASIGLVLPLCWIDCETYHDRSGNVADPGPDAEWLARFVEQAETVYGMACGLYTGAWWVDGYFPGGREAFAQFKRLPLWLADYDGDPTLDSALLPGWPTVACKQYTSTPVDLNAIRGEYTIYHGEQPEEPCDTAIANVRAIIDRKPYRAPSRRQLTAALAPYLKST